MFCGFGFFPWIALSRCDHTHEGQNEEHQEDTNQGNKAIEILKERYARGEITKEQFQEMRKTIEEKN